MENVFKMIVTMTVDKEETSIYRTLKCVYLFNLELLPVDLGVQIYDLLSKDKSRETRTIITKKDNVEEHRTEYLITDDLEALKKKVGEV